MSGAELRPHHGLCTVFFVGKGYSRDFTRNMEKVKSALDRGTEVRLTLGADVICKACPHNICGACESGEKVRAFDRRVLELTGLREGEEISSAGLRELIYEKILEKGLLEQVCGECQWAGLCREVLERGR